MIAGRLITIFCDVESCGRWDDAGIGDTAKEARDGLRRSKWVLAVPNPDGGPALDFCPRHADRAAGASTKGDES